MSKARDSVEDLKTLDANLAAKLPKAGGTMTGDTLHGDNVKAKFGTAPDLEIYHDGNHSYISEVGTGALKLKSDDFRVESASGTNLIKGVGDVASLYNAGNQKLATTSTGVSVTGTLSTGKVLLNDNGNSTIAGLQLGNQGIGLSVPTTDTLHLLTADQTRMTISSSGNVGIGNSSPQGRLHLNDSGTAVPTSGYGTGLMVSRTDGLMGTMFGFLNSPQSGYLQSANFTNSGTLPFLINPRGGNVGIGTSSPISELEVYGASAPRITVRSGNGTSASIKLVRVAENNTSTDYEIKNDGGSLKIISDTSSNSTTAMTITNTGNVGIGTSSPATKVHLSNSGATDSYVRFDNSNAPNGWSMGAQGSTGRFQLTQNGVADRVVVDTAGAVIVGKSTTDFATTGINLIAAGEIDITASGGAPLYLRRNSSNGIIQAFYRDATAVGSISVTGSATSYGTLSDHRLKTDVQPMTGATATFMQLNPVNFEWIADGTRVDGFLAHELQEVIPAAATGTKDAMKDEEYEVTPATGDIYTAGSTRVDAVYETVITVHARDAVEAVMSERNVTETIETGSYINLAGETIVETTEQVVTTEVTVTEVQRHDIDGVSTEVEVEVTRQVPITESYEVTPAIAETVEVTEQQLVSEAIAEVLEVIHSSDVEQPETLEDGQQWRETTAQVMATRSVPDMQGIDQAKVVPLLVATIQELIARVEALEVVG